MFEHEVMRKVCVKKRDDLRAWFDTTPRPVRGHAHNTNSHLLIVAKTFVDMLQHRHTADYDGSKVWSRVEVWEHIDAVTAAFASWNAIRNEHEAQNFLVTLLLRERKP